MRRFKLWKFWIKRRWHDVVVDDRKLLTTSHCLTSNSGLSGFKLLVGDRNKTFIIEKNWHNFETNDNCRLGQVVKKHSCSSRCWFSRFGVSFSQGWRLCGRSPICFLRNTYSRHRQTCWASEKCDGEVSFVGATKKVQMQKARTKS